MFRHFRQSCKSSNYDTLRYTCLWGTHLDFVKSCNIITNIKKQQKSYGALLMDFKRKKKFRSDWIC